MHLSARVPWHDNKWNGCTCKNVLDNSFCRILPRIDGSKNPDKETCNVVIDEHNMPPCIAEKGTFLSPHQTARELEHAWKDYNTLFKDFKAGIYYHKPYSINAVPFLWMMKNKGIETPAHYSEKGTLFELDYSQDLEAKVDAQLGFEGNIWVQHPHNQKVLLDAFFGSLKKQTSLVFFYCKHTPLSEPNERVIVGVAKVRNDVGPILEYAFDKGYKGHKSYPWDRCVEHTLTGNNPDGFLLPYHEFLEFVGENKVEVVLKEYVAYAPDFMQFSYASELVEHDTAIDALLNIAESLKKIGSVLGKTFADELSWIDNEVSKVWDMRGAFPGMGPVLSALGIEEGNTIAWEIEKYIREKDGDLLKTDPWNIFEESIKQPAKYIKDRGNRIFTPTAKVIWDTAPNIKKELYKLISRCQLTNDQAEYFVKEYKEISANIDDIIGNLYLLYEKCRFKQFGLTFNKIDKALLPPEKIRVAFPISSKSSLSHNLDLRRIRASVVEILETAAESGHSLLDFNDVLNRLLEKSTDEPFPINEDVLLAATEDKNFQEEVFSILPSGENPFHFLKLQRLCILKDVIRRKINLKVILRKPYSITKDWLEVINTSDKLPALDPLAEDYADELLAREEKAEALNILSNYRFSVLIGPAGSGKTTLLEIFENLPEIKSGGVLKLAPTGKARVKLGHDAMTIAQFLVPSRYDGETGYYHTNEAAPKYSGAKTVIIDESSMLTEEQISAVFDEIGPVDRMILVGDYRQLPPIGTGRPFVDIVNELRPQVFGKPNVKAGPAYAELVKIRRQPQKGDTRWDVCLSKCFSDEPSKDDLELFFSLTSGMLSSKHIRFEKWYESSDFRDLFDRVVQEELALDPKDLEKSFNRTIGATDSGDYQYFNCGHAEEEIEKWQIITPVNGFGYGVREVNKFVQTKYRNSYIKLALNLKPADRDYPYKRKIAKPKGTDNIVYGDKVINLRNTKWYPKQWIRPSSKKTEALNYFANGEIGVITGEFRGQKSYDKGEPRVEVTFSTQPGYSYVFWPDQIKEDGRYSFELAYAITVHKSQGSGFEKVFFILPSAGPILSRELLYTALTRQEQKIIILHQGDFKDFIRYASTEASATARRFTDLFHLPDVRQQNKKWFDSRYVNISEKGEPMLSKNEVIIANALHKYKDRISYAYEDKLKMSSGRTIKPDFVIENLETQRLFYWEHLGMMTKTSYLEKWKMKLQGYLDDGFVLSDHATIDDDKVLILTEENPNGGINSQDIDRKIREIILEDDF